MAIAQTAQEIKSTTLHKKPKQNLKWLRDKNREMVRGIFRYHECPGGSVSFVYREFKEDQVERFDLWDGLIYTIPLGVAKHINKNTSYPIHAFAMDEFNKPTMRIGKKVQRCSFESLEFVDIEDLGLEKEIITVEKV